MIYLSLKYLHVSCVVLSGFGFFLRGCWMLVASPQLQQRWVKIAPHLIDTVLLGSAIGMAIMSAQYPFAVDWLTAKFFGLLVYIGCGMVALKRGQTKPLRAIFFVLALLAYGYIISVALTRNPAGILSWW